MTPLARFVVLASVASALLLTSILLVAVDRTEAGMALGAVTAVGFVAGILWAAGSIPYDRLRTADEYAKLGRMTFVGSGLHLLVAASYIALRGSSLAGALYALLGAATAVLGMSWVHSARMLRLVPELTSSDEDPRALALGANAMPGRRRSLVAATDDRIVWAEGQGLREWHSLRLADVERFEADRRTGTLTVAGAGRALRVSPVSKQDLAKFEQLLRRESRYSRMR